MFRKESLFYGVVCVLSFSVMMSQADRFATFAKKSRSYQQSELASPTFLNAFWDRRQEKVRPKNIKKERNCLEQEIVLGAPDCKVPDMIKAD